MDPVYSGIGRYPILVRLYLYIIAFYKLYNLMTY